MPLARARRRRSRRLTEPVCWEIRRRPPHALSLPFSLWIAAWLADCLAEETGLRMSVPSVQRLLRAGAWR
jgi:hypothetical protein